MYGCKSCKLRCLGSISEKMEHKPVAILGHLINGRIATTGVTFRLTKKPPALVLFVPLPIPNCHNLPLLTLGLVIVYFLCFVPALCSLGHFKAIFSNPPRLVSPFERAQNVISHGNTNSFNRAVGANLKLLHPL